MSVSMKEKAQVVELEIKNKDNMKLLEQLQDKVKELNAAQRTGQKIDMARMSMTPRKTAAVEQEVPPEILDLRKELRRTQKYLGNLRQTWQNDKANSKPAAKAPPQRPTQASQYMQSEEDNVEGAERAEITDPRRTSFHPSSLGERGRASHIHPSGGQRPTMHAAAPAAQFRSVRDQLDEAPIHHDSHQSFHSHVSTMKSRNTTAPGVTGTTALSRNTLAPGSATVARAAATSKMTVKKFSLDL